MERNNERKQVIDQHIRKYFVRKVRERFPNDFHLIEPMLDDYISRYSLKELLARLVPEVIKLKNQKPE